MNTDEIESEILLNKFQQKQNLIQEFESLRPNWKSSAIRIGCSLTTVILFIYFFPGVLEQPALYVLFILVLGSGAEIHAESRKINKRIDALYKLLKNDA